MSVVVFLRQNARWLGAGALLSFLSSFGQTFFIAVFAGEIRADFALTHGQWGGIYALGTALAALAMLWAGGLADVFRVRQLGSAVLIGLALACLGMALNPVSWALLGVVFALRFFGQSMSGHIAMVAMARWFDATRGRALAITAMGFAVGEAVLPVTFVSLKAHVDWHFLWLGASGFVLLMIPVLMVLLRKERTPQSHAEATVSRGMGGRQWTRAQALRHPLFWTLVPAILGPSACITAFFFHQVHLTEVKGWAHIDLVRLFPVYTGVAVGSAVVAGWGLDRFGAVRLMPAMLLPLGAAFVVFSFAGSAAQMLPGFVLMAMTSGCMATLPNAFWAEAYGTAHIGAIKAVAAATMVLGSAIGPALTGALIDLRIGIETQFLAFAVYFAAATVIMAFGIGRARQDL
ncbi:MAG: MFS transporter [Pseudomonadota bacterium]